MVKSKFAITAFLLPFAIIVLTSFLIFILIKNHPLKVENFRWIDFFMAILFSFTWLWLFFGELRTKLICIKINENLIEKSNLLGLLKKYNFKNFDGYQTSILTSRGGSFEYLYLIKDGKKTIKISEFYHSNYFELKNVISNKVKSLGTINFSHIDEVKEIFK